jgi:hypothetical protein
MIKNNFILTNHVKARIKERGISEEEIKEVIRNPDRLDYGIRGETIVVKKVNEKRTIQVAYKIERRKRIIITAFLIN